MHVSIQLITSIDRFLEADPTYPFLSGCVSVKKNRKFQFIYVYVFVSCYLNSYLINYRILDINIINNYI